ncbi:MAG TPA: PilZ domain-containing protein [Pseudobdellovibrionaceae bacterium]|nr:PilZ domain-containing protein [Pseudobdellovibrionaceae bacterium]
MSKDKSEFDKQPDQFFFEKIDNQKERDSLFDLLTYERKNVLIKSPTGYFSSPLSFTNPPQTFTLQDKPDPNIGTAFEGTLHFELRGLKYLCKGKFYSRLSTMKVDIEELYYVQRRNSFRVIIPESNKILFQIETLNGRLSKNKCRVLDLSSKGIKLQFKEKIDKGDVITGFLIHPETAPTILKGTAKHIVSDAKDKNSFKVGIEFVEQSKESENFLFLYTLDLYRKIYRRKDL